MAKKLNTAQPLVISYLRFSTAEQLKGDSTRRQTDLADDWCRRNGRTLTDRLDDKGVSAFRGKNTRTGALATFLELVQAGTVPPGSILLVEDLDRISRQKPHKALSLFFDIVDSGVTVVTLRDGAEYSPGNLDMNRLMMSVMRFCLAHDESDKKSGRLAEAWAEKRKQIASTPLTGRLPAWLKIAGDKIVVNETRADIVREMFRLALDGHGLTAITRKANERWTAMGKAAHFARSTVAKILHSEHVIGIFQPHKMQNDDSTSGKRRVAVGKPVTDYYPSIIDAGTFWAVQKMLRDKKKTAGPSGQFVNIFQGLIFNLDDQSPMVISNKGKEGRKYVSAAATEGRKGAASYVLFPAVTLEAAILYELAHRGRLHFEDTTGADTKQELAATEGQIVAKGERVGQLRQALLVVPDVVTVAETLGQLETEIKGLEKRAAELRSELAATDTKTGEDALQEVASVVATQQWADDDQDRRIKLRTAIRRLVKRIDCRVSRDGHRRRCEVVVTNGKAISFVVEIHTKRPGEVRMTTTSGQPLMDLDLGGDRTGTATVSAAQVEQIKAMWSEGLGGVTIARKMSLSTSTVYRHKPSDWKPRPRGGRWYPKA